MSDILYNTIERATDFSARIQAQFNQTLPRILASEVMAELEQRCGSGQQYTTFPNTISDAEKAKLEAAGYIVTENTIDSQYRDGCGDTYIGFQVALNETAAEKAMIISQVEENGIEGGGGSGGDVSRYTVEKVTASSGEVTYKLMQQLNNGTPEPVGEVIGLRGSQMLVDYGGELKILDTAMATIKEKIDATYNFTTFTELGVDTANKTLAQITDELYALNLPTNTIVTGQLYSSALPFDGNGEAEVMINSPAFWWKCTSLTEAPYSWNAIVGGGSWSGVKMDWTPSYFTEKPLDYTTYSNDRLTIHKMT